jgi:hypothetical protein
VKRKIHFENPNLIAFPVQPGWLQTDVSIDSLVLSLRGGLTSSSVGQSCCFRCGNESSSYVCRGWSQGNHQSNW